MGAGARACVYISVTSEQDTEELLTEDPGLECLHVRANDVVRGEHGHDA